MSVPDAPVLTSVTTSGGNSATLTWSAVAGALTYNVYRGDTSGGETVLVTGIAALTYIDNTVTSGSTYYYTVTAVNLDGESTQSNEIPILIAPIPNTPAIDSAQATPNGVVVTWNAAEGAVTYNVYRGTTSGGESLLVTGIAGLTYTDNTVSNGVVYFYTVTGVNTFGESAQSSEVNAYTQTFMSAFAITLQPAPSTPERCLPEGKKLACLTIDFTRLLLTPTPFVLPEFAHYTNDIAGYYGVEFDLANIVGGKGLSEVRSVMGNYRPTFAVNGPNPPEDNGLSIANPVMITNTTTGQTVLPNPNGGSFSLPFYGVGNSIKVRVVMIANGEEGSASQAGKLQLQFANFDVPTHQTIHQ